MNDSVQQSGCAATSSVGGKLIMVCGAARSGTTMLDLMLGNSDDALSTGEIYALFRPFRVHHKNPVCSCGERDCQVWQGLCDVPQNKFHANILLTRQYQFVIDSSKDLRWVLDSNIWARSQSLAIENVVLWKDPIDLSYSYWRRGKSVDHYRRAFLNYYGRLIGMSLPFVAVSYKQLATETAKTLELLCNRLGMDYSPSRMNFWEKRHHHFFGSAGTRQQVDNAGSAIRYQTEFPPEFLSLFKNEQKWLESDSQFGGIMQTLLDRDVHKEPVITNDDLAVIHHPLWYYRHSLKALWWKYFPQQQLVHD